jgi:hypothetical protein
VVTVLIEKKIAFTSMIHGLRMYGQDQKTNKTFRERGHFDFSIQSPLSSITRVWVSRSAKIGIRSA